MSSSSIRCRASLAISLAAIGAAAPSAAVAAAATAPAAATDPNFAGPPLSLAQAEATALEHQPALVLAQGQLEVSEGRVEEARAGYLPQVGLTGTYQRTTGNFAPRPGGLPSAVAAPSWSATTFNYFNFGATASQLIYDFGQTDGRWRAASASRSAAVATEHSARLQTLLGVRRAYLVARAQKDLVAVAEDAVRNLQRHLDQTQGFVSAGIRADIDLARARTDLANAKVQYVNAYNTLLVAMATLNQSMGVAAETRYQLTDVSLPPIAGEEGSMDVLLKQALDARPELVSLKEQERAQVLTVRSIKGAYGPTFGAAAGATESGTQIDHLVPNWFLGLTLAWPLFQGGLTTGQVREANGNLKVILAQEDTLRLQVRVDVEQAQLAVMAAKSTISAAGEALANARDQLRLAERRYETGIGSAIELGDAQVAMTTAAAQEVSARYGLEIARAQLLAALGGS